MKRLSFLSVASCLLAMSILAPSLSNARQTSIIGINISNEKSLHNTTSYALFEKSNTSDAEVDKAIRNVVYLKLNKQVLQQIMDNKDPLISIALPSGGSNIQQLTLNNFNILDEGFKVYEQGADGIKRIANVEMGQFYRGIVEGSDNSLAGFTFQNNEMGAVFSTVDGGNYNLVLNYHNPGINHDNYILFRERDVTSGFGFTCGVNESFGAIKPTDEETAGKNAFSSCHKLRVSMHGDYRLYQRSSNNLANSTAYLTLLFNMNSILLNNEGINSVLSEIVVHTAADGYTFPDASTVLNRFGKLTQANFDGDIAQLVTGYRQGGFPPLGGIAWLDVICHQPSIQVVPNTTDTSWVGPYSIVNNFVINNIEQVPVYSWDVNASVHEMGHNIGSRHTQSCTWPGGPIDDCVPVEDGSCAPGPHPGFDEGTIMSYCHLDGSVGVNFTFGFGPLPGDKIRSEIATKSCMASFKPLITLTVANTERIANRQCNDGDWTYFYYDNNTSDETDDELLLMIDANGQDIGDVDVTGMLVKMTTQSYSSNTGRAVTAPYGAVSWTEFNRTWSVTLPTDVSQPTAAVGVRFPYTNQDVSDVNGTYPAATETTLKVVTFKTQAAADNPTAALTSDVNFYTNTTGAASATKWKKGTTGNYNYAEFITNTGVFGGSMGFRDGETGIGNVKATGTLAIYPNPATTVLNVQMPGNLKANESGIVVIDNLGRTLNVKTNHAGNDNVRVDISGLSAGVYCIRLMNNGQSFNGYFVKH